MHHYLSTEHLLYYAYFKTFPIKVTKTYQQIWLEEPCTMLLGLFIFPEVPMSDMGMMLRSGHGYDTPILQIYGKTYKN